MQEDEVTPLLWTRRQAVDALNVSERHLFNLERNGEVPVVKIGKSVRYLPADIEAFVKRIRSSSTLANPE